MNRAFLGLVALTVLTGAGVTLRPVAPAAPVHRTAEVRAELSFPLPFGAAGLLESPERWPQTPPDAADFLRAVRGADPVACAVAAERVGSGWGGDTEVLGGDRAHARLVRWALHPSLTSRDLGVLTAGLRDHDPCVRSMAARLLARGDEAGGEALVGALESGDPAVRAAAAAGLGYTHHEPAVAPLLARLGDTNAGVRAASAWTLGRMEACVALQPLGRLLEDPILSVRLAAIQALGDIDSHEALDLLLPQLRSEEPRVRAAAVRALGEIG